MSQPATLETDVGVDTRDWTVAIQGMTCASCVVRLEKALQNVPGVKRASVSLATGSAVINARSDLAAQALNAAIDRAGYHAAEAEIELNVSGMTCASCVARIEKALVRIPGVEAASVNLATERAHIRILQDAVTADELVAAIERAGYQAAVAQEIHEEVERGAWVEAWPVMVAAALSLPLVIPTVAGFLGMDIVLPIWLQWLLATPVQFWLGARFYRAGWKALKAGAAKATDAAVAIGLMHRRYGSVRVHCCTRGCCCMLHCRMMSCSMRSGHRGRNLRANQYRRGEPCQRQPGDQEAQY